MYAERTHGAVPQRHGQGHQPSLSQYETEINPPTINPPDEPTSCPTNQHSAHRDCGGLYPWMVYRNLGGVLQGLPTTAAAYDKGRQGSPHILHQPVPLESDDADSSSIGSGAGGFSSGWHFISDVDGDGHLDAAVIGPGSEPTAVHANWWFFRGDGKGGFVKETNGLGHRPYNFLVWRGIGVNAAEAPRNATTWPRWYQSHATAQLLDINGDGLPDHLHDWFLPDHSVRGAMFGNGAGFIMPNPTTTPQLVLPNVATGFSVGVTKALLADRPRSTSHWARSCPRHGCR